MREVTIKITKCGTASEPECPFAILDASYCNNKAAKERRKVIRQNKNGITASCPMYPQSVEVEE